ncbi:MAG: adenylate/guanylate cyclase domain-containing protein [Proteobacteria bacterium]|nr:adenylate/guanylate cyclase domain-containing protein [Pseudomonadota bacterium]
MTILAPSTGEAPRGTSLRPCLHTIRGNLRLASALVMLAFVVCHLTAHSLLLISLPVAELGLTLLMKPWRSNAGTALLVTAFLVHYLNALWSIYVKRSLRLSRWEWWQLGLGMSIPVLLLAHVVATRVAEQFLDVNFYYSSILLVYWKLAPWRGILQAAALLAVWSHACIGIHFWLRTKAWYPDWRVVMFAVGLLLPTLALAGFVSGGNQVLREARNAGFVETSLGDSNVTQETRDRISDWAAKGLAIHVALVLLPFAARGVRSLVQRRRRPPILSHAGGRNLIVLPGATVLETLRENGIAHASVCGGRARCTTCRIQVTRGLEELPPPERLEAKALARIEASPGMRLACQVRPTADIAVTPLCAVDATAADGRIKGGLEGSERLVTVVFVDLRGSTTLGESKLPYDVLYILNLFFHEMTNALIATNGHYSQFTGDGLMALYGLHGNDPATGAVDALRGAREMLARLDQLNHQLRAELAQPLRIGIGIHFSEAIVGSMGPPGSQIITAIGDTVNTCARLESLTKEFNCSVIVSRRAAEMAGINVGERTLHDAPVKGRIQTVQFYTFDGLPDVAA